MHFVFHSSLDQIRSYVRRDADANDVATAAHEAAHAVAVLRVGSELRSVTARTVGEFRGACHYDLPGPGTDEDERRIWAYRLLVITRAGQRAPEHLDGYIAYYSPRSIHDERAIQEALEVGNFPDPNKAVATANDFVRKMFKEYTTEIDRVAVCLLKTSALSGDDVRAICPNVTGRIEEIRTMFNLTQEHRSGLRVA